MLIPRVVLVFLIAAPLVGAGSRSEAATVDLSWDQCVTGSSTPIVDRVTTTPGVHTIALTGRGLAGRVIGTHFVFELRSPEGLPAAWRFDAGGCNEGNLLFQTSTTTKACPTIGGSPSTSVQYVMDPGGRAATLTIDVLYGGSSDLSAASTYSLGRLTLDFTSPGCDGLDQPVCVALVEADIVPWGGGATEPLERGQTFVRWNDPGNQTACSGGTLRGFHVDEFTVTCASYDLEAYFLELAPPAGGTTLAGPIAVRTESATGAVLLDEIVTGPERVGQPWSLESSWLIGTQRFANASQLLRDHEAESFLDRSGGRIILRDARPGGPILQDLRYGAGEAIPAPGAGRSIVVAEGGGYVVAQTPAPRNFAGATATIVCRPLTEDRFLVREFSPACFSTSTAGQFVEVESLSDSLWSGTLILDVLDGAGNVLATRAGLFGTGASSSLPGRRSWLVATSQFQGAVGFWADALWNGFPSNQARLFRLRSPSFGILFEAPIGTPGAAPIPDPGQSVVFELDGSFAITSPPTPRNSQGHTRASSDCFPADTSWVAGTSGIRIGEIATGCFPQDSRVRFFELRADRADQELNRRLHVDVLGNTGNLLFSASNLFAPRPDGTGWPEGRSWLFGSDDVAAAFGVTPDGPCPSLDPTGGRIRIYDERLPGRMIDEIRYGAAGTIAAPPPGSSIRRAADGSLSIGTPPEAANFTGVTSSGNACPPARLSGVRIAEISTHCTFGDSRTRFIELEATRDDAFHRALTLSVLGAGGQVMAIRTDLFAPVTNGTAWPAGRSWLLGSPEVTAAYGVAPDATCPVLDTGGGTIRLYDEAAPEVTIHEIRYGPSGSIAAPPPGGSIRRAPDGTLSVGTPPEPVNFAGATAHDPSCPCPLATFRWGGSSRSTDAVSFDSTSGSRRLAFDRRNPSITIHLGSSTGAVTLGDRFVVTGGATGQEIEIIALFNVRGSSWGPCYPVHGCAGGGGTVAWSMEDSSGSLGSWPSVDRQFAIPLRVRIGEPFPFFWTLETYTDSNGSAIGEASFNATFEWANLPPGLHVESCAGYLDDTPVAVLPSIVSATAEDGVVRLEWSALTEEATALAVERRTHEGDWSPIGTPEVSRDRIAFEDRAVVAGERYAYRLGWSDGAGETQRTEETWVETPGAVTAFAARIRNGIAQGGPFDLALSLPNRDEVRLALYDLRGRRLADHAWTPERTGAQDVRFAPDRALAPGVYWIRVTQGAERTTMRAIVLAGAR